MQTSSAYLSLKVAQASKSSKRATGSIHYRLLTETSRTELFIRVEGNDGGGYISTELVAYTKVLECLKGLKPNQSIPAKVLRSAFVNRSANNPGFLAAILRAEKLLEPVPETAFSLRVVGDWDKWCKDTLMLPGEFFALPLPETKAKGITSTETIPENNGNNKRRREPARQHPTQQATVPTPHD